MKIFEFRFNPGNKPDLIFDSFCYQPSSASEKKLGFLCLAGELRNALPQNSRLLSNLALLLKREYYFGSLPDKSLKKALKKANDFLAERAKTGNVSWLGNFSFAILSLAVTPQEFTLNFSQDGPIKILLLRPGQVMDLGKAFEMEEFEPYPLKVFTHIVAGRFLENDKILVAPKSLVDFLTVKGWLLDLSRTSAEKDLRDFFKEREKETALLEGLCLLLLLTRDNLAKNSVVLKKAAPSLSLTEILSPLQKIWRGFSWPTRPTLPALKLKEWSPPKLEMPDWKDWPARKNVGLILLLALFLAFGAWVANSEKSNQRQQQQDRLIAAQEKAVRAQNLLSRSQSDQAEKLFQEALAQVLPLTLSRGNLADQARPTQNLIEKNLLFLNKVENHPNLDTVFDFANQNFSPQHLIVFGDSLYFFSAYERKLESIKTSGRTSPQVNLETEKGFTSAAVAGNNLYLLSKPNRVSALNGAGSVSTFSLSPVNPAIQLIDLAAFRSTLYSLEKDSGNIVSFQKSALVNQEIAGRYWIALGERKAPAAKSLQALASLVFVLADNGSIWQYQAGRLVSTISPDVFPAFKRPAKILVSPLDNSLVVLEPAQNRLVWLDSQGESVRQLTGEKLVSLKDASFSGDGKILFLLSGSKVYRFRVP